MRKSGFLVVRSYQEQEQQCSEFLADLRICGPICGLQYVRPNSIMLSVSVQFCGLVQREHSRSCVAMRWFMLVPILSRDHGVVEAEKTFMQS